MRISFPSSLSCLVGAALITCAQVGLAQEAMVTITTPAEGATLSGMGPHELRYEVMPGPKGDHVHLYVDSKEAAVLRQLKGSYTLKSLSSGPHEICIKVVNKGHTPIGVQQCVKVTVN